MRITKEDNLDEKIAKYLSKLTYADINRLEANIKPTMPIYAPRAEICRKRRHKPTYTDVRAGLNMSALVAVAGGGLLRGPKL